MISLFSAAAKEVIHAFGLIQETNLVNIHNTSLSTGFVKQKVKV